MLAYCDHVHQVLLQVELVPQDWKHPYHVLLVLPQGWSQLHHVLRDWLAHHVLHQVGIWP